MVSLSSSAFLLAGAAEILELFLNYTVAEWGIRDCVQVEPGNGVRGHSITRIEYHTSLNTPEGTKNGLSIESTIGNSILVQGGDSQNISCYSFQSDSKGILKHVTVPLRTQAPLESLLSSTPCEEFETTYSELITLMFPSATRYWGEILFAQHIFPPQLTPSPADRLATPVSALYCPSSDPNTIHFGAFPNKSTVLNFRLEWDALSNQAERHPLFPPYPQSSVSPFLTFAPVHSLTSPAIFGRMNGAGANGDAGDIPISGESSRRSVPLVELRGHVRTVTEKLTKVDKNKSMLRQKLKQTQESDSDIGQNQGGQSPVVASALFKTIQPYYYSIFPPLMPLPSDKTEAAEPFLSDHNYINDFIVSHATEKDVSNQWDSEPTGRRRFSKAGQTDFFVAFPLRTPGDTVRMHSAMVEIAKEVASVPGTNFTTFDWVFPGTPWQNRPDVKISVLTPPYPDTPPSLLESAAGMASISVLITPSLNMHLVVTLTQLETQCVLTLRDFGGYVANRGETWEAVRTYDGPCGLLPLSFYKTHTPSCLRTNPACAVSPTSSCTSCITNTANYMWMTTTNIWQLSQFSRPGTGARIAEASGAPPELLPLVDVPRRLRASSEAIQKLVLQPLSFPPPEGTLLDEFVGQDTLAGVAVRTLTEVVSRLLDPSFIFMAPFVSPANSQSMPVTVRLMGRGKLLQWLSNLPAAYDSTQEFWDRVSAHMIMHETWVKGAEEKYLHLPGVAEAVEEARTVFIKFSELKNKFKEIVVKSPVDQLHAAVVPHLKAGLEENLASWAELTSMYSSYNDKVSHLKTKTNSILDSNPECSARTLPPRPANDPPQEEDFFPYMRLPVACRDTIKKEILPDALLALAEMKAIGLKEATVVMESGWREMRAGVNFWTSGLVYWQIPGPDDGDVPAASDVNYALQKVRAARVVFQTSSSMIHDAYIKKMYLEPEWIRDVVSDITVQFADMFATVATPLVRKVRTEFASAWDPKANDILRRASNPLLPPPENLPWALGLVLDHGGLEEYQAEYDLLWRWADDWLGSVIDGVYRGRNTAEVGVYKAGMYKVQYELDLLSQHLEGLSDAVEVMKAFFTGAKISGQAFNHGGWAGHVFGKIRMDVRMWIAANHAHEVLKIDVPLEEYSGYTGATETLPPFEGNEPLNLEDVAQTETGPAFFVPWKHEFVGGDKMDVWTTGLFTATYDGVADEKKSAFENRITALDVRDVHDFMHGETASTPNNPYAEFPQTANITQRVLSYPWGLRSLVGLQRVLAVMPPAATFANLWSANFVKNSHTDTATEKETTLDAVLEKYLIEPALDFVRGVLAPMTATTLKVDDEDGWEELKPETPLPSFMHMLHESMQTSREKYSWEDVLSPSDLALHNRCEIYTPVLKPFGWYGAMRSDHACHHRPAFGDAIMQIWHAEDLLVNATSSFKSTHWAELRPTKENVEVAKANPQIIPVLVGLGTTLLDEVRTALAVSTTTLHPVTGSASRLIAKKEFAGHNGRALLHMVKTRLFAGDGTLFSAVSKLSTQLETDVQLWTEIAEKFAPSSTSPTGSLEYWQFGGPALARLLQGGTKPPHDVVAEPVELK